MTFSLTALGSNLITRNSATFEESMEEIRKIFDVTGGTERYNNIEKFSKQKAKEMGKDLKDSGIDNEYVQFVYSTNNKKHNVI